MKDKFLKVILVPKSSRHRPENRISVTQYFLTFASDGKLPSVLNF